jgi:hypothetical protein
VIFKESVATQNRTLPLKWFTFLEVSVGRRIAGNIIFLSSFYLFVLTQQPKGQLEEKKEKNNFWGEVIAYFS